jgi:mono/diheme cytochrome c family protein
MSVGRSWRVVAALLLAVVSALSGCSARKAGRAAGAHADSSFAAVTFQRGRSPEMLSEARGHELYDRYCAICHGTTGGGDGFNAYNLKTAFNVTPTAFDDSAAFHALHADSALAMIRGGGAAVGRSPAMPPWGKTLTPGEVVDVWQYIGSLSREAAKD